MSSNAGQSTRSGAPTFRPDVCDLLCWGLLYHMLGLSGPSREKLDAVAKLPDVVPPDKDLGALAHAVLVCLKLPQGSEAPFKDRQDALVTVVQALGVLLVPSNSRGHGPDLSKECQRCSGVRRALDLPLEGYSRDPFKELTNPDRRRDVALAAILYVARAHALFFAHPRTLRGFNAAKVALNDLFQAGQLAVRLYYSLEVSHLKKLSQKDYLAEVRCGPPSEVFSVSGGGVPAAHASAYFIWWVLELVEIQRGNIYRQIEHLERAERYYRHAEERFERLAQAPVWTPSEAIVTPTDPKDDKWFITPTLVLALSERAKIQFDLGHLAASIGGDLRCLALLVRRWLLEAPSPGGDTARALLKDASRALEFLRVARGQWVIDKAVIARLFKPAPADGEYQPLTPDRFVPFLGKVRLPEPERKLAADLFARLGFALFLLRVRRLALRPWKESETADERRSEGDFATWLKPYFTIAERLEVKRPALAWYSLSLLPAGTGGGDEIAFPDMLERQLAQRLRETLAREALPRATPDGPGLNLPKLCSALLELTTQNIDNIVTIPRRMERFLMRMGYRERKKTGDVCATTVFDSLWRSLGRPTEDAQHQDGRPRDKLVVLRRWQSFNPRIPRPVAGAVRGGGYFLLWQDKGIVIDPGYDFIQNFYEEGFSLEDIDAVVVTHSHPDHEDDLSTLTTLAREWNDLSQKLGKKDAVKLDLMFLNESSHLKFAAWLKASQIGASRIVSMPLVVWAADSESPTDRIRGDCTVFDLRKEYGLKIEVVPAWHDDVIGRTAAVGLKFHLYPKNGSGPPRVVGYTGDTGAYGWPVPGDPTPPLRIDEMYRDCDVLVANLGDLRLCELATLLGGPAASGAPLLGKCLDLLLRDWFWDGSGGPREGCVTPQRVEEFLGVLVNLHLASGTALKASIGDSRDVTVAEVLGNFIKSGSTGSYAPILEVLERDLRLAAQQEWPAGCTWPAVLGAITSHVMDAAPPKNQPLGPWRVAYALLGYLCARAREGWRYEFHLGIEGIYRLHKAMREAAAAEEVASVGMRTRVFVVGELPEELASYRHQVTRLLNMAEGNWSADRRRVHAFTGDIGLHVGLTDPTGQEWKPQIRCAYCNYNNESVLRGRNYHAPENTLETCIKKHGAAMVYLCTEHDHHPENEDMPFDYLVSPNLRVV